MDRSPLPLITADPGDDGHANKLYFNIDEIDKLEAQQIDKLNKKERSTDGSLV